MASISPFFIAVYAILLMSQWSEAAANGSGNDSPVNMEEHLSTMIGVQGLIYCKRGPKLTPIEGAVARLTCETRDEYGYEAEEISVLSQATDAKGYFMATLSPSEVKEKLKIKECRTFLEVSPMEDCEVATEINRGISGAILSSYRLLHGNLPMKLFTVGPFVFAPDELHDKSISNGF